MRYQVPQFIEIEDKIFGPLTIKQFLYLAGGGALCYLVYTLTNSFLPLFLVIALIIPIAAFAAALAFYKINGKPLIHIVEFAVKYLFGSKLYIWKKETKPVVQKEDPTKKDALTVPRLADSRLKDLAWNLDISKNPTASGMQNRDNNI